MYLVEQVGGGTICRRGENTEKPSVPECPAGGFTVKKREIYLNFFPESCHMLSDMLKIGDFYVGPLPGEEPSVAVT